MKQFFKFTFASCLGTLFALGVIGFIAFSSISKLAKSAQKQSVNINPNSILKITLKDNIPEMTNNLPINPYDISGESVIGLTDMIAAIGRAKEDDRIKGIYMEVQSPVAGLATLSAFRKALVDFKESGKFIIAYSDFYSQKAYYMVSVADKIYLNPMGGVDFAGFSAQIPYFKNMLDKFGIEFQIFYAGDFKSATEPYRRSSMSEENRTQTREFLTDFYNNFLEDISASRNISVEELKRVANEYLLREAEDAVTHKFVDELVYKDQVLDELRRKLGLEKKEKINGISISKYNDSNRKKTNYKVKDKIAVIYSEGTITYGSDEAGSTDGEAYAKMIRKIRQDDKIKGIVLRVNSPGGSGLASELIWRELTLAKEQGLPVVVSMGDYAASGGYYIACMADTIYAEKNTLTGSIGVFGMFPVMEKLMRDQVGVTFDTVKTGEFSAGLSPFMTPSEKELAILQASTDTFYSTFLKRVADGRKMTKEEAHKVAQGRVWTAKRAVKLGLVDKIGGLDDAIATAANLAGLPKYRTSNYPKIKEPLQQILDKLTNGTPYAQAKTNVLIKEELGEMYEYYEYLKEVKELKGIQARLPFTVEVN